MSKEKIADRLKELVGRSDPIVPLHATQKLKHAISALGCGDLRAACSNMLEAAETIENDAETKDQFNLGREILSDAHSLALASRNLALS